MVSIENVFNPDIEAPMTVKDAHMFADEFDGRRPPFGHPLDFNALGIDIGWAPWGNLTDDVDHATLFRIPSNSFWDQLVVPAFPLRVMDGPITDFDFRLLQRKLLAVDIGDIMRRSNTGDITLIMYCSPSTIWASSPIISEDFPKTARELQFEIEELTSSREPSDAMVARLGMKETLLYVYTGI